MNRRPFSTIVFDVNETLLDITILEPLFARLFDDKLMLREWFAQLVLYSQTLTLAGIYTPFSEIGVGALQMSADIHDVTLSETDIDAFKALMGAMPAHPDAVPALNILRQAGFRLVTLTNSPPSASPTPLEKAGLSAFFEQSFSVDTVSAFKPAPQTYQLVADTLSVPLPELCMVACHLWDTIGAQAAGCHGAFLQRPYNALLSAPNVPSPDFIATDLVALAEQMIKAADSH